MLLEERIGRFRRWQYAHPELNDHKRRGTRLVPKRLLNASAKGGGITKTGNREARRMLIEAAWSYRYPARIAKEKAEILVCLPKNIRDIAWKAQTRLGKRYRTLIARGKKPTIVVAAIARELAGFIWAIGQEMRTVINT